MKNLKLAVLSVVIFLTFIQSIALADSNKLYKKNLDPFYPENIEYFTQEIYIKETNFFKLENSFAYFTIHHSQTKDSAIWFISTTYNAENWIFVEELKFLIDGKIFNIKSEPLPKHEASPYLSGFVLEENLFLASNELIEALKNAKSVKVRLNGQHYFVDGDLPEKDIKYMSWFYNEMISTEITSGSITPNPTSAKLPSGKKLFGINFIDLSPKVLSYLHNPDLKGVIVVIVTPNSVAEKTGIKINDVIFEFDGKSILSVTDLQKAVAETIQGNMVSVKCIRDNKEVVFNAQF